MEIIVEKIWWTIILIQCKYTIIKDDRTKNLVSVMTKFLRVDPQFKPLL